jgi:hypothetical protein
MNRDARRVAAAALVVLASILLLSATVAGYGWRAVLDSDQFANRATATLGDSSVRSLIGERVTDRVVLREEADLLAARPIIASAVSSVVGGSAFRSLFHRAALDVHRAVFARDQNTVTLTVADVGTVAAEALRTVRPQLAQELDRSERIVVAKRDIGGVAGTLARIAHDVHVTTLLLAALTVAAMAGALVVSRDRRLTVSRLGLGVVVAGVVIVIACAVAKAVVLDAFSAPDDRAAAGALWDAFLADLRTFGWVLAGAGAVVAAAAASLIQPIAVEGALRRAWRTATTEPRRASLRVARGVALIVAGALVILEASTALQVAATLVGVYLVYKGLETILRLIYRPPEPAAPAAPAPRRARRRLAVSVIAALVIAIVVGAFVAGGGVEEPAAAITGCNGHAELCDRPLDEVVLPARHNSMSAPLPGWFSAEQDRSIGGQLQDGIRGLLLDTHYADKLANGRIRTHFGSPEELGLAVRQDGVSEHSAAAARRLRERLGFRGEGTRGMYLCHTFCELGATPLSTALDDVHDFLVTHPSEVVVMVNQDYVTPADFVAAIGEAGLTPYVFTAPSGSSWPTLGEMVRDGRRLVLLAENHAGAAPWYQLAYRRLTEETPYTFRHGRTAHRAGRRRGVVPTQPRPRPRTAVPRQPLGQHRPGPTTQ